MKVITYNRVGATEVYNAEKDIVEKQDFLYSVSIPWSTANEEIAKRESYNGEYEIVDDGEPEPENVPTSDERIAALEEELAAAKILLGVG